MIYIDTGRESAARSLAAEYYFAAEKILDDDVFLFWQTKPTLVVGKYQNVYEEIDIKYVREHGINVIRRLSGGGTVYLDAGSFLYSYVGKGDGEISFERYLTPVCNALRSLGVPAECDGRNDITAYGRKISGNSQYKTGGRTVHHGTILFDGDIDVMERATRLPNYKITSKSIKSVRSRVVNIAELLPNPMSAREFADFMISSLAGDKIYVPDDADWSRISTLAEEMFPPQALAAENKLPFDMEREITFEGAGSIIISVTVRNDVITSAHVRGDFFSVGGVGPLTDALCGVPFRREDVYSAIADSSFEALGISAQALAERFSECI